MEENPGKIPIRRILDDIHSGNYVIPHFQRDFEWRPRMVGDLIESILQDYYTGLLLFWQLDKDRKKIERWDSIWGAKKGSNPTHAVLDGQQRISSLYYAFYNPQKKFPRRVSYYVFYINLFETLNGNYDDAIEYTYYRTHYNTNKLLNDFDSWIDEGLVPLPLLVARDSNSGKDFITSTKFTKSLNNFITKNENKIPSEVSSIDISNLLHNILQYKFTYLELSSSREKKHICNIFARINERGLRLSTFDLLNAFLYPEGISLRKDLWENLDYPKLKEIDDKMNEYLLKAISLYKQNICSAKFLYNLIPGEKITQIKDNKRREIVLVKDASEFKKLWYKSSKLCEKARINIMNTGKFDFGSIKQNFIPNTTVLPVLAAINWKIEKNKSKPDNYLNLLQKWYWSSAFSEEYSGSSDSVMAKDYRIWTNYIETEKNEDLIELIDNRKGIAIEKLSQLSTKSKGSAPYNAVLCLLALNGAQDFYYHRSAGSGDYASSHINDHHIFPDKIKGLEKTKSVDFRKYKHKIFNRTLLYDETNIKISETKPSIYFKDLIDKHGYENLLKLLESHLISKEALNHLLDDYFDKFIKERENTIIDHIKTKL